MSIISLQSHVAAGHVGNSAAVYPLQRMGYDVCPVYTAALAHHPKRGEFHGALTGPDTLTTIFHGLRAHGIFNRCDALLSGYLGNAASAEVLLEAWQAIRYESAQSIFCCMPVIGDRQEGIYVDAALPDIFKNSLVPAATIIIANAFELEQLSGIPVNDLAAATCAGNKILKAGPSIVIATSVPEESNQNLANVLIQQDRVIVSRTRIVETTVKGTGDFFCAVWLGQYLALLDPTLALGSANAAVRVAVNLASHENLLDLPVVKAINYCIDQDDQFLIDPISIL